MTLLSKAVTKKEWQIASAPKSFDEGTDNFFFQSSEQTNEFITVFKSIITMFLSLNSFGNNAIWISTIC